MGWPQVGWTRPTFDTFASRVMRTTGLGDPAYWKQLNAWTPPVAISEQEYAEIVATMKPEPGV